MKLRDGSLSISPTDLSQFLSCRHRNALELSVAHGVRKRPKWDDPRIETLVELGMRHEREYVHNLKQLGKSVADLNGVIDPEAAIKKTHEAMQAGVDIIVQAGLSHGNWYGRPDVLMKVNLPSNLGPWSYEPADAKLARDTRGGTILQLGLYCELLQEAQGVTPVNFHVISPLVQGEGQIQRTYRLQEYAAYFRLIKAQLEQSLPLGHTELERLHQPEPVDHCLICPWFGTCQDKWRADDHLCLVAGISRLHRRELPPCGVDTLTALAATTSPFAFKPKRGNLASYERIRDQALIQIQSREEGRVLHQLIPQPEIELEEGATPPDPVGLARLPLPSPGDVFLDLEGDSLASNGGREYLFGLVTVEPEGERYQSWWATNSAEERTAFEAVVDLLTARLAIHPDLHIYHYAPYEPTAFKRLMGRYATREDQIDRLLRSKRFIDLYAVVRQSMRVGVERYSIKNLEPLYNFQRKVNLKGVSHALKRLENALEFGRLELATPELRDLVEGYNRDDCVSTLHLRNWLEQQRSEAIASGQTIDRPLPQSGAPKESLDEKTQRIEELRQRLLTSVPEDPEQRTQDQQAMFQLAYLLDWHRREEKSTWWEYYRMLELPEEDLLEEAKAVGQLECLGPIGEKPRTFRFQYPPQEFEVKLGETLNTQAGDKYGDVKAYDRTNRTIDLLLPKKQLDQRPTALFIHGYVDTKVMQRALLALGQRVANAGSIEAIGRCPERALLLRETPTLANGAFSPPPPNGSTTMTDYATQIVAQLDRTALAIQGPPGSGKTYTGAKMIIAAVRAGLKVGVTATSHKVINNLLSAVVKQANEAGLSISLGHIESKGDANKTHGPITRFTDNGKALAALDSGDIQVMGGTAWPWSSDNAKQSVDILFVDEAGQVSLANVLAVAGASANLVLLGDPQQLEQPSKGSHPDGVGLSALQHILGKAETMPPDKGLFLPVTRRLSPSICQFTSELFYASQLTSSPGTEHQTLLGSPFDGQGLWLIEVQHDGNSSASDEEATELLRIVTALLEPGVQWVDHEGQEHQMLPKHLLVVAPFNAHVNRIEEALRRANHPEVRVGTVDKFQGQEAPVAIYAMATSRPEDAPRGLEFLYSLNRLNVATSRARCAAIILASPHLFHPDCQTPAQMKLANALCRFREMASRGTIRDYTDLTKPRLSTRAQEKQNCRLRRDPVGD